MNTNEHDRQDRVSAGPPTLAVVSDLLAVLVIKRARQPHAIQHRRRALEHALQRVRKVVHVLMQFIKQEYIPPLAGRVIGPKRRRDSRKGSRNPSVPIEKLSTGGTAPTLKSDEACRIVPSPPSVMTRSIFSASSPARARACQSISRVSFSISSPHPTAETKEKKPSTETKDRGTQKSRLTRLPELHVLRDILPILVEHAHLRIARPYMPKKTQHEWG